MWPAKKSTRRLRRFVYLLVSQVNLSMLPYVEDGWADDGRFITRCWTATMSRR